MNTAVTCTVLLWYWVTSLSGISMWKLLVTAVIAPCSLIWWSLYFCPSFDAVTTHSSLREGCTEFWCTMYTKHNWKGGSNSVSLISNVTVEPVYQCCINFRMSSSWLPRFLVLSDLMDIICRWDWHEEDRSGS